MTAIDRENSVLSALLFANRIDDNIDDTFILSADAFTSSFRQRVAVKINATTTVDKAYGILMIELEESIIGTIYESQWIDILSQTPMALTLAKRYHDTIRKLYNEQSLKV